MQTVTKQHSSEERYNVTMTKEQLIWLMQTMEKWSRIQMGQTDVLQRELESIWHNQNQKPDMSMAWRNEKDVHKELKEMTKSLQSLIWPYGERYNDDGDIAWDFYQTIRYFKWCELMTQEERDKVGVASVLGDTPMHSSSMPLPVITRVTND